MRDWKSFWPSVTLAHDPTWPDIHDDLTDLPRNLPLVIKRHENHCIVDEGSLDIKCFVSALGPLVDPGGGGIRLPNPPLPLLCLPIFLLKNHVFSQFWAPLPLPLNLGLDSTLDPARRFWRVNGAQKCAKRYFYSKSRGKGGKLRVWTGTIVPFALHLTPVDPVGGGGEISRDPEAKKVHFTPPKAKFCHFVLKILFLDSPSPKCWFSQPHKLSSDICLRAQ